jgi:hypothetical protein
LVADFLAALRYRMENLGSPPPSSSGGRHDDDDDDDDDVAARTREIARRIDAYGLPMAGMMRVATPMMKIPSALGRAGGVAMAVDDGGENGVFVAQAGDDGEEEAWGSVSICVGEFRHFSLALSFSPPPSPPPSPFYAVVVLLTHMHPSL